MRDVNGFEVAPVFDRCETIAKLFGRFRRVGEESALTNGERHDVIEQSACQRLCNLQAEKSLLPPGIEMGKGLGRQMQTVV
jgi:hypothetical protein